MVNRVVSQGVALAALVLLVSCGGGGGEPAATSNPDGTVSASSYSAPGLQLAKQQLTLSSEHGDSEPVEIVSGVVNGASAPMYVYVQYTNKGVNYVNFSQTSNNGGQLRIVGKDAVGLTPGRYADMVRVTACYDPACMRPVPGSPKDINVAYEVKAAAPRPTLLLGSTAIAFAKVPFGERLSHDVSVDESGSRAGQWSAATMASWLQVTPTGTLGSPLKINALPQGLAPGLHQGLVAVTSSNPANGRTALIRVGLYISQTAVASTFAQQLGDNFLIDPARPFTYSITDSVLHVDHIYTGQRLRSVSIPGVQFGEMAMNNDGSRLVVADADGRKVWLFDTDQGHFTGGYTLPEAQGQIETRRIPHILKANGRDVLVVVGLTTDALRAGYYMMDLQTGIPIPQLFTGASWQYDTLTVGRDGRRFMVFTQLSPNSLRWGQLTENSKGRLLLENFAGGRLGSGQVYLNSDFVVSDVAPEALSCQGILSIWPGSSSNDTIVDLDTSLVDTFSWTSALPNFSEDSWRKRCYGIESYEGNQLFITNYQRDEFHLIERDGTVQRVWMKTSDFTGVGGMKLSSDYLRVIDAKSMQDLPR